MKNKKTLLSILKEFAKTEEGKKTIKESFYNSTKELINPFYNSAKYLVKRAVLGIGIGTLCLGLASLSSVPRKQNSYKIIEKEYENSFIVKETYKPIIGYIDSNKDGLLDSGKKYVSRAGFFECPVNEKHQEIYQSILSK